MSGEYPAIQARVGLAMAHSQGWKEARAMKLLRDIRDHNPLNPLNRPGQGRWPDHHGQPKLQLPPASFSMSNDSP